MILVVGSTGLLGGEVCRLLLAQGQPVRALVREAADPAKVSRLRELGADIAVGDLRDPTSLAAACDGATAVVSTATAASPVHPADGVVAVDGAGQSALVDAAARAGVSHFVFISFSGNLELPTPFHASKREVERRLQQSGMNWTILRPAAFMELWLSPAFGFDVANDQITIYGTGGAPISYISYFDVARFCVAALNNPAARNRTFELGGPDAMTPLQIVKLVESVTGRTMNRQHVPVEALRAQYESAPDPLQKSFAGLMLSLSGGDAIDMRATQQVLPLELRTVRQFVETSYGRAAAGGEALPA